MPPTVRNRATAAETTPEPACAGRKPDPTWPGTMPDPACLPRLSGFTIVRNATLQDYPIEVALRSALALCDEVVVNVGASEDDTLERVERIRRTLGTSGEAASELRILHRRWPDAGGSRLRELARETNAAMDACRHDWALYLQADEALHEEDLPALRGALARAAHLPAAEGLLFDYLHFEGSPDWVLEGRRRYRREVRVVRRSSGVRSVRDAQSFEVEGRPPRVLRSGARIFHYGYVKSQRALDRKRRLGALWYGRDPDGAEPFVFRRYGGLRRFEGSHPAAARGWLEARRFRFDPDRAEPPPWNLETLKVRLSDAVERRTGCRLLEHRTWELIG